MRLFFLLGIILCLNACQSLPDLSKRIDTQYIPTQHSPRLEETLQLPIANIAPPNAYLHILDNAQDAFVARSVLIDKANISLDIQYYIWRNDITGNILLQKLWQAAERGVRVRLLLDDNNTRGMDDVLSFLNQHDKIEIRLFNPFVNRKWRALGYLTDFERVNRRMHNKSLTADNVSSIIGGRNISDEYFSSHADTAFADMDVLVSGSLVTQISQDFDLYWNSQSSYPIEFIIKNNNLLGKQKLFDKNPIEQSKIDNYLSSLSQSNLIQEIENKQVNHIPAQTQLVSDDPAKGLRPSHNNQNNHNHQNNIKNKKIDIGEQILQVLGQPEQEIYLVSPYFVPTKKGTAALNSLSNKGINITVLTNSLAASDVAAVHSGYMPYRKSLLKSGVKLYEFQSNQSNQSNQNNPNQNLNQNLIYEPNEIKFKKLKKFKDKGLTGSSSTSLHAKTFIVDKKRVFVGSFNFDPRSVHLNTEMGVVIYNPQLASNMQEKLQQFTQENAYQVELNQHNQNQIQWRDPETGEILHQEPKASFWKRLLSRILSILPIERLL